MEKKIKPGDKPLRVRVIYGVVIAILCITAIVIGIVAAASKTSDGGQTPPVDDGTGTGDSGNVTPPVDEKPSDPPKVEPLAFIMPVAGTVGTSHSTDAPVFSDTLGEWRVHTGIDIMTEEDAPVLAAEDGVITSMKSDPLLGFTVEITHEGGVRTVYSNLKKESVTPVSVGDEVKKGDRIGTVGDTAISEIADEAHLHLEVYVDGAPRDPMDFIAE